MTTICRCRVCARRGEPFEGVSLSVDQHITAEDLASTPRKLRALPPPPPISRAELQATLAANNTMMATAVGDALAIVIAEEVTQRIERLEQRIAELELRQNTEPTNDDDGRVPF